jgi:hypothetical protein
MLLATVPYEEFDQTLLFYQMLIQLVSIGFMIVVSGMMWQKYLERKTKEILFVALYMTLFWIGLACGTIPIVLCLYARHFDLIFGIPLGNGLHLWWTNFSYLVISIATIFMFRFIQLLFRRPSKYSYIFFIGLNIIFNIWSIYHGIFVYTPGSSSLTLPMSGIYLFLGFQLWVSLFWLSAKDLKKIEPSPYRAGLKLISISALFMILGYVFYMLNVFISGIGILVWGFYLITAVLLYLGFLLPPWFRKRLEKRYPK